MSQSDSFESQNDPIRDKQRHRLSNLVDEAIDILEEGLQHKDFGEKRRTAVEILDRAGISKPSSKNDSNLPMVNQSQEFFRALAGSFLGAAAMFGVARQEAVEDRDIEDHKMKDRTNSVRGIVGVDLGSNLGFDGASVASNPVEAGPVKRKRKPPVQNETVQPDYTPLETPVESLILNKDEVSPANMKVVNTIASIRIKGGKTDADKVKQKEKQESSREELSRTAPRKTV